LAKEDITDDYIGYYKLIMHPHRRYVQNMIEKIKHLEIKIIAPSHGFIIRKDVQSFMDIYDNMSKNIEINKKALILYSSMTGNTKKIGMLLKNKLEEHNVNCEVLDVNKTKKQEVLNAVTQADMIFFGTSTKYADMIGNMEEILKDISTLSLENKIGAVFGSFGWSGEAMEVVQDYLKETNIKILNTSDIIKSTGMTDVEFPLRIRFSPKEDDEKIIERAVIYTSNLLLSKI
jgi:flavorubredoxin